MKIVMVIIFCMGANCQTIYDTEYYDSVESCVAESAVVSKYMEQSYPGSTGQVYCMAEDQFNQMQEQYTPYN